MRRIGEIIDELDLKGKNDELVKELVELSTKHGILTPYTSFLADENAPVRQLAAAGENFEHARRTVDRLAQADGVAGVSQRAEKKALQEAGQAPQASAPAFGGALPTDAAPTANAAPGGAGGRGYSIAGKQRASNSYRDIESDKEVAGTAVQNVGRETLYKRGKTWVANNAKNVDPEKDSAKIKRVTRFSDDYFALVKANTQEENQILASQQEGEELLVMLRGQAYMIE